MRWTSGRRSENVEDRRGVRVTRGIMGGGIGTIILVLVALYFGVDPSMLLNLGTTRESGVPTGSVSQERPAEENRMADFVSVVLADTEDTWHELFRRSGKTYQEPKLVLFSDAVDSACGYAQSAMGPFYCSRDNKVYIDLQFYRDLQDRFHAPGEFAQAYVIAHEIGHHVQHLLGISDKVHAMQQNTDKATANNLSVRLELQADCFAGIWGHHADRSRNIVESGDIEAALRAAGSIGDDRIQKQSQGYVVPESFTHGSSEQRVRWFKRGIETGDFAQCNTFKTGSL
ncbi:MAG: flagellar biosynthesis protein FlgM [Nitrospirae bacterium]|nr:flagellar biosynthesis protein FlgM [Nitrospirota bacterium]